MKMLILGVLVLGFSFASARECSSNERDWAEVITVKATQKLIREKWYPATVPVTTEVTSCKYNTYSHKYKIMYNAEWNGAIFKSNHYWMSATLYKKDNSSENSLVINSMNDTLRNYISSKNFWGAIGATIIFLDSQN